MRTHSIFLTQTHSFTAQLKWREKNYAILRDIIIQFFKFGVDFICFRVKIKICMQAIRDVFSF